MEQKGDTGSKGDTGATGNKERINRYRNKWSSREQRVNRK
jgi:hypothetical protein